METAHAKTPYILSFEGEGEDIGTEGGTYHILVGSQRVDHMYPLVAVIRDNGAHKFKPPGATSRATAEFIVKACNSYQTLMDENEKLRNELAALKAEQQAAMAAA